MSTYNYYKAKFSVVTATRARLMGIPTSRHYGYYVLIDPPVMNEGKRAGCERVMSWCKTKRIAMDSKSRYEESQIKGYYGCPCGKSMQARSCCGIPKL